MTEHEDWRFAELRNNIEDCLKIQEKDFISRGLSPIEAIEQLDWLHRQFFNGKQSGELSHLPAFDTHGYLPAMHQCTVPELRIRFGQSSDKRIDHMKQLDSFFDYCREITPKRILLGGSFITNREPGDVDVTIQVEPGFLQSQSTAADLLIEDYSFANDWTSRGIHVFLVEKDKSFWKAWCDYSRPKDIGFYASGSGIEHAGVIEVII